MSLKHFENNRQRVNYLAANARKGCGNCCSRHVVDTKANPLAICRKGGFHVTFYSVCDDYQPVVQVVPKPLPVAA